MRLLIVTQKVDERDSILGFFHAWIIEFAKHFDSVSVICLEEGSHQLPGNVKVFSLGKEKKHSQWQYIKRFYSYMWNIRNEYDVVFVHMNPIYVVLGGFVWKLLGKKITLWYVHRAVDMKLRIAGMFSDTIFTAAPESCRLKSDKIQIVGHGIDTELYAGITKAALMPEEKIRILHVGRITKIKNCDVLLRTAQVLKKTWNRDFEVVFIGGEVTPEDIKYRESLNALVAELGLEGQVTFQGSMANADMPRYYSKAHATVNLTPTGGIDKAVLESLASEVPVFFSNEAFLEICAPYENIFHIAYQDSAMLAEKIMLYFKTPDASSITATLRQRIIERFDVSALISRISLKLHDTSR